MSSPVNTDEVRWTSTETCLEDCEYLHCTYTHGHRTTMASSTEYGYLSGADELNVSVARGDFLCGFLQGTSVPCIDVNTLPRLNLRLHHGDFGNLV